MLSQTAQSNRVATSDEGMPRQRSDPLARDSNCHEAHEAPTSLAVTASMGVVGWRAALLPTVGVFKQEAICAWIITFIALNHGGWGGLTFSVSCGALWLVVDRSADLHSMITFAKIVVTKETPVAEGIVRVGGQFCGAFIGALLNMIIADSWVGPFQAGNTIWILWSCAIATAAFLLIFFKTQEIANTDTEKAFWFMLALLAIPGTFPTNPAISIATNILQEGGPAGDFYMWWFGPFLGVISYGLVGWVLSGEKPAILQFKFKLGKYGADMDSETNTGWHPAAGAPLAAPSPTAIAPKAAVQVDQNV